VAYFKALSRHLSGQTEEKPLSSVGHQTNIRSRDHQKNKNVYEPFGYDICFSPNFLQIFMLHTLSIRTLLKRQKKSPLLQPNFSSSEQQNASIVYWFLFLDTIQEFRYKKTGSKPASI
jgi:hypothetical protein